MPEQPHWLLVAGIGSALGFLLPYFFRAIVWLGRRFKKYHLEGDWHEYHLTFRKQQVALLSEKWRIRKGFIAKLVVVAKSMPTEEVQYKGTLVEERSSIVANFKATTHTEQVTCRLRSPVPSNDRTLVGFWLAIDFDGRITAGPEVLSRDPLNDTEVRKLFQEEVEPASPSHLMRLKS